MSAETISLVIGGQVEGLHGLLADHGRYRSFWQTLPK